MPIMPPSDTTRPQHRPMPIVPASADGFSVVRIGLPDPDTASTLAPSPRPVRFAGDASRLRRPRGRTCHRTSRSRISRRFRPAAPALLSHRTPVRRRTALRGGKANTSSAVYDLRHRRHPCTHRRKSGKRGRRCRRPLFPLASGVRQKHPTRRRTARTSSPPTAINDVPPITHAH